MRSTTVLLSVITLFLLSCACTKDSPKSVSHKGLRGKIIVRSCVTTAVQVLNSDIGSTWTDCRDQKTYQNMIDVVITSQQTWPVEGEFTFDIEEDIPHARCFANDYCGPAPSEFYHIVIKEN